MNRLTATMFWAKDALSNPPAMVLKPSPENTHGHREQFYTYTWVELFVWRYLSNTASFVFSVNTWLIRLNEFAALFTTFEEHVC